MGTVILYSIIVLAGIAAIFAVIIYFVGEKFKVLEDPRIDEIQDVLPGANCGGCGKAGCRAFAEALVKANSFEGLFCPVGGNDLNKAIGPILGIVAVEKDPEIAVVRCAGTKVKAPAKVEFDGPNTCLFAHMLYQGESGCSFGCFGLGDCVVSCQFDAIQIDETTGLPVVNEKCCACGACVKACPRSIIELRKKGPKDRRIFVSCVNKEKGGPAKKNCEVACIGCSKCVKVCKFDAITITNNLAYIDFNKCKLCRKCTTECPTGAIWELNFPERKPKAEQESSAEVKTEA
ncbi:MAG TPA: ferredoxin [Bacteroidales bacterium]|nr:MAG: ferredoxin [Bacteroidetes bacterium GWF2_35_48]OFY92898.1 MAG: ferredoxin [Bacteroidetes bacterium RIFOXYC12_FULL_35_7]HBX51554.1 ferredoxin [Bacteroidales bacterium]